MAEPVKDQATLDAQWLLEQEAFLRFLLSLLEFAGMDNDAFNAAMSADHTAYRVGQRSVGIEAIRRLHNANPRARLLLEHMRLSVSSQRKAHGSRERNPEPE